MIVDHKGLFCYDHFDFYSDGLSEIRRVYKYQGEMAERSKATVY